MSSNYENVKRYYDNNCTEFKIRQVKADAQVVKDYAAAHGCSVQALFLAAVRDYMAQGKTPEEVKRGRKSKKEEENKSGLKDPKRAIRRWYERSEED